ncbi:MAG: carboxymuconolactone decarboxylase family protein [Dehalococcoidales bacterium]
MKFKKRTYKNPAVFFRDVCFLTKNRSKIKKVVKSNIVSPQFQERLMLAVTAVNDCRYCSHFHTKQALKSGLSQEEIDLLLSGNIANCPEDEYVALIYAQYWAETNANPDSDAVNKLKEVYSDEKAEAIELILRMIRMGNLMGNTWDYFLYRVSFGRLGV